MDNSINKDVVVSTRIRLARNLKEYPFVNRMTNEQKEEVIQKTIKSVSSAKFGEDKNLLYINMSDLKNYEQVSLVEKHLVSPDFVKNTNGKGLLLSNDTSVSLMINEEDHIRIQILSLKMDLEDSLNYANNIDELLDESLKFAFDDKLGYLTQCPTNLGTGLRASVMVHLPLLESNGYMPQISSSISKLGLTIRGTYGEGTGSIGSFYQISNQVTLGISEESAAKNLEAIVLQIVNQERELRKSARTKNLEDQIYRAYGILKYARILSQKEFMNLLSFMRLGIDYQLIDNIGYEDIDRLSLNVGDATLMSKEQKILTDEERNILRADIIRQSI